MLNTLPTGSLKISGTPKQGQILTATQTLADINGLGAITYQWYANGVAISGATGATYALTAGDVGKSITVVASYTDALGTAESVSSAATALVANLGMTDLVAPVFRNAVTNSDGTKIILTYGEMLNATTAQTSAFVVKVGGVAVTVSSVVVNGSTVELTLASAVGQGQAVTVAYADPTAGNDANAVQDLAGNDAASLAETAVINISSTDLFAPVFKNAVTSLDGTKVILAYGEALVSSQPPRL